MKKIISILLLACVSIFSLISCGGHEHEHNWGEWQVKTPAKVLTDGLEYRACECGEQETRIITKIGLEKALLGDWVYTQNNFEYKFSFSSDKTVEFSFGLVGSGNMLSFSYTYTIEGTKIILTSNTDIYLCEFKDLESGPVLLHGGDEYIHIEQKEGTK